MSCRCALGSRKDRHENIGRGMIGIECFKHLMNDSRLDGIPLIVEARPLQQVNVGCEIEAQVQMQVL